MKFAPMFAVILAVTSITVSAQGTQQPAAGAALLRGEKFACLPSLPQHGASIVDTQLLTCLVAEDVKSKLSPGAAIQKKAKLVGSVQGQKVTWFRMVTEAGLRIDLDAKGGEVMVSEVQGNTIPDTLTVHVMRDLAFN